MTGRDWLLGFRDWYPPLLVRCPEGTSLARPPSFNKFTETKFFENLKFLLEKRNCPPQNICKGSRAFHWVMHHISAVYHINAAKPEQHKRQNGQFLLNDADGDSKPREDKERTMSKKRKRKPRKDSGQEYTNTCGKIIPSKEIELNPCLNKKRVNKCNSFLNEDRQNPFQQWNKGKRERYKHLPKDLKTSEQEENYSQHLQDKEALKQNQADEESTTPVASFDLQKVLFTPHGDSMTIGFS
ncbi:hypothetical protein ILUMI_13400 [Ignelater luminosus]|uniref:Uncharacterized protein n=1 Tax=Ignelater luminosus TaxID=2038154 RepID=A0A8K0CXV3_IGNLU|nr:hypothetical protein ILUMI_13400 [Ignelater luminosus]